MAIGKRNDPIGDKARSILEAHNAKRDVRIAMFSCPACGEEFDLNFKVGSRAYGRHPQECGHLREEARVQQQR